MTSRWIFRGILLVIMLIILGIKKIRNRNMFLTSEVWPITSGKCLDGEIRLSERTPLEAPPLFSRSPNSEDPSNVYSVHARFEYFVAGRNYRGEFLRNGFSELDMPRALRLLDRIKADKLDIRYDPSKPSRYFVDEFRDIRA